MGKHMNITLLASQTPLTNCNILVSPTTAGKGKRRGENLKLENEPQEVFVKQYIFLGGYTTVETFGVGKILKVFYVEQGCI